jgi:transposase-like protein
MLTVQPFVMPKRKLDNARAYETVRNWLLKSGHLIPRRLQWCRPRLSNSWHLDEMWCGSPASGCISARVDHDGEVFDT